MSDVTGPISTLPGSRHALPPGTMCDDHPDRPATARVQGETDSFGSEMLDLCRECVDQLRAESEPGATGCCDWCHKATDVSDLKPKRDIDEGLTGPVYYVCSQCRRAYSERVAAELNERCDEVPW